MILELVNDYLLKYTNLKQENIYQGYQNCVALPQDNTSFCVLTIMEIKRRGTNVENVSEAGRSIKKLVSYAVDVDVIGDDDIAQRELASRIEALSWSEAIRTFFSENNASMLYADNLQDVPYLDEDSHFMHRYRVRLYLSAWEETFTDEQTAKEVVVINSIHGKKADVEDESGDETYYKDGIENIDVHHKGG